MGGVESLLRVGRWHQSAVVTGASVMRQWTHGAPMFISGEAFASRDFS